ncbi:bifunctional protein-serine/threonine kinase/phosphatase [Alkalimarinus coralli]|uniref:bifunctional protein-serine/threonine kinase/phosphatase n=1 Tax=Alkalimarinus coralli TaxID=2935863 RepID=UPI00202B16E2|nr:bifunctional protein-serine/threonine kinase/phosphatase [Alkalimarinus coralli]
MKEKLKVSLGQCSDRGRKSENQDNHGARLPNDSLLALKGVAIAMSDGISSSDVSHIASETAVNAFLEDYYCTSEAWSVKTSAERVLKATNSWLNSQSLKDSSRYDRDKGYVCTFSAVILKNLTAHIFHVGDSRVYRLNENGLEQLTHDHRLWETEEKSYLSRAMGMAAQCEFDYQALPLQNNDIYIICTDGVYEFVKTQQIVETVRHYNDDLNKAARTIAEHAYNQGSEDNLTIQIVKIESLPTDVHNDIKKTAEALNLPPALTAGVEFDGYEVLRQIHTSSRSLVYLAQDKVSKKNVVLKIPTSNSHDDKRYIESFLLEEWIARRLSSAHVLKAKRPDRERQYIYTVFEFIEGQTLAQWAIDNPKPSLETVRGIVEQIAKGLHAFHRMEMLHQDLRPENIMIDTEGTVKIIDFGSVSVAGLVETEVQQPLTYLKGTALYSAPEYFLGCSGTVKSELFSLGVITYFLLSGRYPYDTDVAKAKTRAAQKKLWYRTIINDEVEIPIWVDDAIHRAVHPFPENRYEEVFEFIHDLKKPNRRFIEKTRPPLIQRNPVRVWQGISAILAMIVVYLISQ